MQLKSCLLTVSLVFSVAFIGHLQAQEANEYIPYASIGLANNAPAEDATRESLVNFSIEATVKKISDGDTAVLLGKNKASFTIRFSDIDTPETEHDEFTPPDCQCKTIPFRPGQPGGIAATDALDEIIAVGDEVVAECYEVDRYGRMVCHIFKDQINVNLEMIKNGWGWLPSRNEWIRDPESYKAEANAKAAKKGAWGLPDQVSPAVWRDKCWRENECDGAE